MDRMAIPEPTISSLLAAGGQYLRNEFQRIRDTNPHAGERGTELQNILKDFLNRHLPKRFAATSGFIIDDDSGLSKQMDIIVYDAFSSAVYRSSETMQIVPAEAAAAVIEVKSTLNKAELRDGFEKIKSVRILKKRPFSDSDQRSTQSGLTITSTYGIIFGFGADTSVNTLAANVNELLKEFDSDHWPDMAVVLDEAVIGFGLSFMGQNTGVAGTYMRSGDEGVSAPFYIHQMVHFDKAFSLNRFLVNLLSHLTFYARRNAMPPLQAALKDNAQQVLAVEAFQFTTKGKLLPAPSEAYEAKAVTPLGIRLFQKKTRSETFGLLQYIPWQDGAIVRFLGPVPLQLFLGFLRPKDKIMVVAHPSDKSQMSSVLDLSEQEFREWPRRFKDKAPFSLSAEIVDGSDAMSAAPGKPA
jgi:hypothetical protein